MGERGMRILFIVLAVILCFVRLFFWIGPMVIEIGPLILLIVFLRYRGKVVPKNEEAA